MSSSISSKKLYVSSVILAWISGQLVVFLSGCQIPFDIVSVMRLSSIGQMSIVWLLLSAILPFVCLFVFMRFEKRFLCLVLVQLKAFMFTYSLSCIASAFSSAGWLLRWLCFFTDSVSTLLFLYLVLSGNFGPKKCWIHRLLVCIITVVIVACVDYAFVSPLATELLSTK